MTRVEPTEGEPIEVEELRGRVLGIIGAYGMGVSLDPRELYLKHAPAAPPPEPVPVTDGGYVTAGVVPRRG